MKPYVVALLGGISLYAIGSAPPVIAQPADQLQTSNPPGLEEIVVTARKREEKLQSVPIAITAFSGAEIEEKRIQDSLDLVHAVPALDIFSINRDGINLIQIRGLPGVVAYFAEVPITIAGVGGVNGLYYDLDNLQVLKGPQGTLFGLNATGGAVLFEPRRPTNKLEGYAQVTLGDYNDHEFEGAINVPIVDDKLLLRVATQVQQRDGFTANVATGKDLDNEDFAAWRVALTARPSDDFENYFLYRQLTSHTNGTGTILNAVDPNGFAALVFGPSLNAALAKQQALGIRAMVGDSSNSLFKENDWSVTDIAKWDVSDSLSLKNIANYGESKQLTRQDFDGTSLPIVDVNTAHDTPPIAVMSDEVQLLGKSFGDKLNWVVGGFVSFNHQTGGLAAASSTTFGAETFVLSESSGRTQAIFTQGTYDLGDFIEGLKFTAGYRYSWDWRSMGSVPAVAGPGGAFVPITAFQSAGGQFHAPGWTLDLDYQVLPDTLLYVTGRKAYSSGAFNTNVPVSSGARNVAPEYFTDVEIGVKSDWDILGMRARTDAAAFRGNYQNIQRSDTSILVTFPNGSKQVVQVTTNAATATIEGLDLEATLVPFAGVELTGNYQYIYGRYDKYVTVDPLGNKVDVSNRPITEMPKNKFSLTARYHLPLDAVIGDVSASATYSWQAHDYYNNLPQPGALDPAYGLLDFRVDWTNIYGRPFDVSFFMTNATDQAYTPGGVTIYNTAGYYAAVYGPPRMWGVQLKYRFGPGA